MPTPSPIVPSGVPHQIAELLQTLIRFDTTNPPGDERECIGYIQGLLTEAARPSSWGVLRPNPIWSPGFMAGAKHRPCCSKGT